MAYQGYGEGVNIDAIAQRTLVDVGQEYMSPDLELILTLQDESVRKSLIESRGQLANPDTFESMPDAFQGKMKDGYELFAKDYDIEVLPVEIKLDQTPEEIEASKQEIADTIWERAKEHITQ